MNILITTENCPRCAAAREKLKERNIEYREIKLTEDNMADIISTMRENNIFKQEMPILIEEIEQTDYMEWREVEI